MCRSHRNSLPLTGHSGDSRIRAEKRLPDFTFARLLEPSLILLACLGLFKIPQAKWNLPYPEQKTYDYREYYGEGFKIYLSIDSTYFSKELAKGWKWYKENFILSNGLVNHSRLENNNLTGTDEAVSEGQGYGMLLALLNNDQPTFNRIFAAANKEMWDGGHKSYFVWRWPGGGSGAATDADLDIGLALVFADELVKAGHWQDFSEGGTSYASRAMEVIRSIRQNMTAQDYLLPGDNWGGDAVNNLNPSYFATAWLKVFDEYQDEVNFGPVVDKCYQVLQKMPHYDKGIAADWVKPDGGQSSQGGGKEYRGLGMLADGIRTPYRIAMDALWFDDPRAKAYCANTKNTLTAAQPFPLLAQMALYTDNASPVTSTEGHIDNVAMWTCGMLGSQDVEYARKGLNATAFGILTGTGLDFFGDQSLQDEKFYYKQSLAMLGFAALAGQFPNVLKDMREPNPKEVTPTLTMRGGAGGGPGSRSGWLPGLGFPSWRGIADPGPAAWAPTPLFGSSETGAVRDAAGRRAGSVARLPADY